MADVLAFYFDHNMLDAVADGLRRRGIDVQLAREVGLEEADDPDHLAHAAATGRVVVTFDTDFQGLHRQGISHAGIAWCRADKYTVGTLVELLEIVARSLAPEQMHDRLEYL